MEWEDAKVAMQEFGNWIKNADTKVAILGASFGVLIASSVSSTDKVIAACEGSSSCCVASILVLLAFYVVSVLATGFRIGQALLPRTRSTGSFSRFSWIAINNTVGDLSLSPEDVRKEAWTQCRDLAQIADRKYSAFRKALWCWGLSAISLVALVSLASWLGR
jgi:hypothetical protein